MASVIWELNKDIDLSTEIAILLRQSNIVKAVLVKTKLPVAGSLSERHRFRCNTCVKERLDQSESGHASPMTVSNLSKISFASH